MAKGFTKNNPLEKLSGTVKSQETQKATAAVTAGPQTPKQVTAPEEQPTGQQPARRKAGRPKTRDVKNTCKNINVAVPSTLLDKWEAVKIVHGSNLTAYITRLIQKDMDANYEHYKAIADSLRNI